MITNYHIPVLLNQCLEGLNINPHGIYVDVTFGGGGHSNEILKKLSDGKLFGFDQDEDAVKNALSDPRFDLIRQNFSDLKSALAARGVDKVDGILADLGVSSHQFDTAERGFSTRFEAELDMRMSKRSELTATDILNGYEEQMLRKIFYEYGELSNGAQVAKIIVRERGKRPIETVTEIKNVLKSAAKKGKENQFYAQVFQALRIEVNDELNVLKELLMQSGEVLSNKGRLVVISYHSLEDRLVKNYLRSGKFSGDVETDVFGNVLAPLHPLVRKAIEPDEEEIKSNPRSRSAKLRIAEKIN